MFWLCFEFSSAIIINKKRKSHALHVTMMKSMLGY